MTRKYISLFTGAGGLDLGFEAAGFELAIAVESDPSCITTISKNRPHWNVSQPGNIEDLDSDVLLAQAGISRDEVSLVIGGPPCQPFSKSRLWVNGSTPGFSDSRSDTLIHFFRVVRDFLPTVFLIENVSGLQKNGRTGGIDFIDSALDHINEVGGTNYRPVVLSLNAVDYGVPQRRKRVFVVAHKDGLKIHSPKPTHFGSDSLKSAIGEFEKFVTVWDAIGDLDSIERNNELIVTGKWADLLPSIPEGKNYLWHTDRGGGVPLFGWRTKFWSFLLKLGKTEPSWTLQASPGPSTGPFHWRNRKLSAHEMCRLQTFPDEYSIEGDYRTVTRQVGNAVPPLLSEVVAREIKSQLFNEKYSGKPRYRIERKANPPNPHPIQPVPEKYSFDLNPKPDHPGVGKGPRANAKWAK